MTCFSIQKTLGTGLLLLAGLSLIALPAMAQSETIPNEKLQIKTGKPKTAAEAMQEAEKTDAPIVLELFTTSDCTACVYADRMLYDTMKDKNVIALSCQIKDMEGLGTVEKEKTDQTGTAAAAPQKEQGPMDPCIFRLWSYKSQSSGGSLMIPNFIFNGYDQVGVSSLSYFEQVLYQYHFADRNKTREVFMRWKDDDTISIHMPEDIKMNEDKRSASIWLVRYKDMAVEKIESGVNQGRVLRFSNIVQDSKHIGKWHGTMRTLDVDVPKPQGGKERGGYVVIAQQYMGSPILAAGKLQDYPHPNDLKKTSKKAGPAAPSADTSIPAQ